MNLSPRRERLFLVVLILALFTTSVDAFIVLPLGPLFIKTFEITVKQFGLLVAVYSVSAGISGVLAGLWLDRVDRKRALQLLYLGFVAGIVCCALASGYQALVAARLVTGAFGGLIYGLLMVILGDVIPEERRSAAMGTLLISVTVANVGGVPLGLMLATHFGWHAIFWALAGVCAVALAAIHWAVPSLKNHVHHARNRHPVAWMFEIFRHKEHIKVFLITTIACSHGYTVMPFIATYLVANAGVTEAQLPIVLFVGGIGPLFVLRLIGMWSDRSGNLAVFRILALVMIIPVLTITNLPIVPLAVVIGVMLTLIVCSEGRMVPFSAILLTSVQKRYRGGFMSINLSLQQFICGWMTYGCGALMGKTPAGEITHYPLVGLLGVSSVLLSVVFVGCLKNQEEAAGVSPQVLVKE